MYLACSGATILKGLVGPYAGVHPEQPDLPAQVHEARTLVGRRKADAVMLSIGVNDVGFSKVASFCAFLYFDYCPNIDYTDNPAMTLAQWLKQQLDALPEKYDKLATALKPLVAAGHVFITEYPDLVSSSSHALCKAISFNPPLEIPERSVDWLYHNFYLPLNAAIRAAAKHHGWRVIDAPPGFKNHGYCNEDGWIVTYQQSQNRQGDTNGTLHPNLRGQTEIADASYPLVSKVLPRRR